MGISLFDEELPSSLSLESQVLKLAVEANFLTNMIDQVKGILPSFSTKLTELSANINKLLSDKPAKAINFGFTKDQKQALSNLSTVDYLVIADIPTSVPDGFNGNLVDYGNFLIKHYDKVFKSTEATLRDFEQVLASFITNKEDKKVQSNNISFYKQLSTERDIILKEHKNYFDAKAVGITYRKFKEIIKRMADVKTLIDMSLELDKADKQKQLKELNAQVVSCTSMLDIIIRNIQQKNFTDISPEAAKSLSQGAFEIAKSVEAVSIFYFDIMQFQATIDKMVTRINRLCGE